MSDIGGPRRPLDLRQHQPIKAVPAPQPQAAPQVQPTPPPASTPVAPPRPAAPAPKPQPEPQQSAPAPAAALKTHKGGAWRVILQFVVGLIVIAGVALAIGYLYVRYYQ